MGIIIEIGLQFIEILTLVFGILGMTFSAMMMFSPNLTKGLSENLNRNIQLDNKIKFLDTEIELNTYFYRHNVVMGVLLIFGSALALFFFYISLDINKFINVFFGSQPQLFFGDILITSVLWIVKLTCLAGLIFGGLLAFAPDRMKRLETKLNSWFETRPLVDKLDRPSNNVDSFFFRYPLTIGFTGTFISFLVLSLSIINLLD